MKGRPVKDLTGKRFGNLEVLERSRDSLSPNGRIHPMWLCRCVCGTEKVIKGDKLKDGRIKSCGCKQRVHEFNEFRCVGDSIHIIVGEKEVIIDKEDLEKVYPARVYIDDHGYAKCRHRDKLHLLIFGHRNGYVIDHINQNKLDNRKSNLRFVSVSENNMNRKSWSNTGMLGISLCKDGKYQVQIDRVKYGKVRNLEDAISIRDTALNGTKQKEVNFLFSEKAGAEL